MTHGLTPQGQRAVELILQSKPLTEVAKAVGLTLPELYDLRYSLPFAEEMAKRQADLRAYTQAMYVGTAREVLDIVLSIARGATVYDDDGNASNTIKPEVRLKACAMLNEVAFSESSTYTTAAEWQAARENATKAALGGLWKLSDAAIVESVRNLRLPSGSEE